MISPQQYRKLMKQYQSENHIGHSAIKAGIDPKTASKYIKGAAEPEEQAQAGERCSEQVPQEATLNPKPRFLENSRIAGNLHGA
jgi:hypothetical protein